MTTTEIIIEAYTQSSSGLAKDRYINVWHFLDTSGAAANQVCSTGASKIWDFWNTAGAVSGFKVAKYMSPKAGNLVTLVCYDQAASLPRPELGRLTFTWTPGSTNELPEEIALCLSYYTDRNLASKRGRIYLGPLSSNVISTTTEPLRPDTAVLQTMVDAAKRLVIVGGPVATPTFVSNTLGSGVELTTTAWALYSPKLGTYDAIEHGWVDDEWDGQRRRRVEASTRITY